MSTLSNNLTARRKALGMTITDVTSRLNDVGVLVAESTVAGWFNKNRGHRWKMEQLRALVGILQTTIADMQDGEGEVVEGTKFRVELARRINNISEERVQALLILLASTDPEK